MVSLDSETGRHFFCFGVFTFDAESGELSKNGARVRLQPQPAQLLTLLLSRAGALVSREEIRRALWDEQTTVDFELGMNRCVRELRGALLDDSDAPRYISTIPRRGYRFIAPISSTRGSRGASLPVNSPPGAPASSSEPAPSIAVLPFANLSGNLNDEYFSDGLSEEITAVLTQLPGVKVIARTSAFAFKGRNEDIRRIAETLNVNHVLEGSIRRAGDQIRVTAQLIHAADGAHLLSTRYDREIKDVFAIQDEISADIARQLKLRFTIPRRTTANPVAHEAYLEGRFHWHKFTPAGFSKALQCYQYAVEVDPGYAQAYTGIAEFYLGMITEAGTPPRNVLPKARIAAQRALALDETDAEAHAALGQVAAMLDYDWSTSEKHFRCARELSSGAHVRMGYFLWFLLPQGRLKEALMESDAALKQDPLLVLAYSAKATALYLAGAYDEAANCCLQALAKDPAFSIALERLVLIRLRQARFDEALAWAERLMESVGRSYVSLSSFGLARAAAGDFEGARRLLKEMNLLPHGSNGFATAMACIHALLGDTGTAFEWLQRAMERRDPRLLWIQTIPWFESLRSDPRYFALLDRMSLRIPAS